MTNLSDYKDNAGGSSLRRCPIHMSLCIFIFLMCADNKQGRSGVRKFALQVTFTFNYPPPE
jgi:hypothetical protein